MKALFFVLLALVCVIPAQAQSIWGQPDQDYWDRWYDKHQDTCTICGQTLIWYTKAAEPTFGFAGDGMMMSGWGGVMTDPFVPDSCKVDNLLRQRFTFDLRVCPYCANKYSGTYLDLISAYKEKLVERFRTQEAPRAVKLYRDKLRAQREEREARIKVLERKVKNLEAGKPENWVEWDKTADSVGSVSLWRGGTGYIRYNGNDSIWVGDTLKAASKIPY